MVATCIVSLFVTWPWIFPILMIVGGATTVLEDKWRKRNSPPNQKLEVQEKQPQNFGISERTGKILIGIFAITLICVLIIPFITDIQPLLWLSIFYRTGSLIYGGGQVVLPFLLNEVVAPGWVSERDFLNGFALVQALPGPNFNFAAYLGSVMGGVGGAAICEFGLFAPGITLIAGFYPFWMKYRNQTLFKTILSGVNAAAIGLVLAAVFTLWDKVVAGDMFLVAIAIVTIASTDRWKVPVPVAVIGSGTTGLVKYAIISAL